MNRPDEERIEGSRPSVPPDFYYGTLDIELDPTKGTLGDLKVGYCDTYNPETRTCSHDHAVHNPTPEPRCRLCKDRLTITDTGGVCHQCRLEGLYR